MCAAVRCRFVAVNAGRVRQGSSVAPDVPYKARRYLRHAHVHRDEFTEGFADAFVSFGVRRSV